MMRDETESPEPLPLPASWRHLPDRQLGWLAGLFDGEGCITVSLTSQNRLILRVALSMTTGEDVQVFAKAFGGGVGCYSYGTWKPFFTWSEGNGAAVEVLEFIIENCRLKRVAALPALQLARDMRSTPSGRAIPAARKAWRLELAQQVVAAVGRRPEGFDEQRILRYLAGRTYSGVAVVASDGTRYPSLNAAGEAVGVTRTAICVAVRRQVPCRGLMWNYAEGGAGKPDKVAPKRRTFAATLTRLRTARGLTVSDVARAVGVTEQACSAWSHEYTLPSVFNLLRLIRLFDEDGDELAAAYGLDPAG